MNRSLVPLIASALFSTLLLPGCSSRQTSEKFTALRVSTYRGETIAEYVARGPIIPTDGGYKIHAVERRSAGPYPKFNKYPYGWDATIVGPRIHHWRTDKPDWLAEWDDEHSTGWEK